jgi:hypothetical protein
MRVILSSRNCKPRNSIKLLFVYNIGALWCGKPFHILGHGSPFQAKAAWFSRFFSWPYDDCC